MADVAAELGGDPFDVLCDIAVANDLRTGFSFPPYGDTEADWQARVGVWRDPRAIIGASDAGAHLDFLATFNYPTVLLRRAVVDLGLLSWEEAISLMTDAPARLYGLVDRGRLVEGAHADVVVIDPERVGPDPVVSRIDLPGRRVAALRRRHRHRPRARQRRRGRHRRRDRRRPDPAPCCARAATPGRCGSSRDGRR